MEDGSDARDVDQSVQRLRRELSELDVELVAPDHGVAVTPGAKGDPLTLGAIALAVLPAVLPKVMDYVHDWLRRSRDTRIRVKIEDGDRSIEVVLDRAPGSAKRAIDMARRALLLQGP
jgi:hypothetical protein